MVHATSLKSLSAVSVVAALLTLGPPKAEGQDQDLARSNQDELASFYGRMNVVVGSGARAFGMGGAFLARADDATAASWNPAGLSYLRRTEVSVVGVHSDFQQKIPGLQTTTLDRLRSSVADFAGFAYPLRLGGRPGAVQVSYQRSFSFSGKRTSGEANGGEPEFTVDGDGGFDSLSLSSGFEVRPDLRLGISVNRWINGFSQSVERASKSTVRTGSSESIVRTERTIASTWDIAGTNFNFGALFTPTPKLNLGAVLKTPFAAKVALSKTRTDRQTTADESGKVPEVQTNRFAGDVQIRFPRVYGVGASYRASNTLTVSADFTRTQWSKATISDFFALAKKDPDSGRFVDRYTIDLPFPAVEEGAKGQADTSQVRIGAEWVLRLGQAGGVLLPLRAGFFRDSQPVTIRLRYAEPGFPYPERTPSFSGFTAGVGLTIGGILVDMAYIREGGDVPASRAGNAVADGSTRNVRYSRIFASAMLRFGQRH